MIVTNRYNLPQVIVDIAMRDMRMPTPMHYSATELLKPIKETVLWRRYYDIITQDVSELLPAIFGTAFHTMLEGASTGDNEHRVSYEICGVRLSGQYDRVDNHVLYDYKTTSVGKFMRGDFSDYKKQGLIYAWLLRKNGVYIEKMVFYMFLKDYKPSSWQANYPDVGFQIWEHYITSQDIKEIETYITERIELLERYKDTPDNELPMPTHEESWYTGDKYAAMKNGQSRALKLYDTEEEARGKGDYVEIRKGEHMKCVYSEFFRDYVMNEKENI